MSSRPTAAELELQKKYALLRKKKQVRAEQPRITCRWQRAFSACAESAPTPCPHAASWAAEAGASGSGTR